MTAVPLHRADIRTIKRYRTTAATRRRHHAGITSPTQTKQSTIFMLVIFFTMLACWMTIFAFLVGSSLKFPEAPVQPRVSLINSILTPADKFGSMAHLDPNMLAGMAKSFQYPNGSH